MQGILRDWFFSNGFILRDMPANGLAGKPRAGEAKPSLCVNSLQNSENATVDPAY
jgi:hypothetical protein